MLILQLNDIALQFKQIDQSLWLSLQWISKQF